MLNDSRTETRDGGVVVVHAYFRKIEVFHSSFSLNVNKSSGTYFVMILQVSPVVVADSGDDLLLPVAYSQTYVGDWPVKKCNGVMRRCLITVLGTAERFATSEKELQ